MHVPQMLQTAGSVLTLPEYVKPFTSCLFALASKLLLLLSSYSFSLSLEVWALL